MSIKIKWLVVLAVMWLPGPLLANSGKQQIVTPSKEEIALAAGQPFRFDVIYKTTPTNERLSGLGLLLHYDSNQLAFAGFSDVSSNGLFTPVSDIVSRAEASSEGDGDTSTDRVIPVAWALFNGDWPGTGATPLSLLSAHFETLNGFTGPTNIRFTASSAASGYEFSSTPVTVTYSSTPVVASVPVVRLTIYQNGQPTREIDPNGGPVRVVARVLNPIPDDNYTFDWSGAANSLGPPSTPTPVNEFSFDPGGLDLNTGAPYTGTLYNLAVKVATGDTTISPGDSQELIRVATPVAGKDTSDTDGDGIPNYLDTSNVSNQLPVGEAKYMSTQPGLHLVLGTTAFASGADKAGISRKDIINYGGPGGGLVGNGTDSGYDSIGGVFDFKVEQLPTVGGLVKVVIPLLGGALIPASAAYRKYTPNLGWGNFVTTGVDTIESARSDSKGFCPGAESTNTYRPGLNAGDDCLRLTLQDGGPNDADGRADGKIEDPGTVATKAVEPPAGGGGGGVIGLWTLLYAGLILLPGRRKRLFPVTPRGAVTHQL